MFNWVAERLPLKLIIMKDILNYVKNLSWQQIISTAILVIAIAFASFYFTSCGIAKSAVSGDRVVDKNVRDSVHYEVTLEK